MDNIAYGYKKEEIEQKISDIKRVLEKDVTTFERKILNDSLKIWEKALSNVSWVRFGKRTSLCLAYEIY